MSSLKTYIQKNRQKIIIALTAILAVYGFIALYFIVEVRPVSNDECLWLLKEAWLAKDISMTSLG
jgi:uncharacterized protein YpmB